MSVLLALLISALPARAGEIVLSAAAGRDYPTDQFWTGLQGSIHPDTEEKWAGMGRLAVAWAFADAYPMAQIEAGVLRAIPHEGEIVRLGLVAGAEFVATGYRLPVEFADKERHFGLIPSVELLVEFEFFEEKPFVFGARGGVGSASSNYLCPTPDEVEDCLAWFPAFTGGFYGRGAPLKWLYLELLVGPSPRLAVGYPF